MILSQGVMGELHDHFDRQFYTVGPSANQEQNTWVGFLFPATNHPMLISAWGASLVRYLFALRQTGCVQEFIASNFAAIYKLSDDVMKSVCSLRWDLMFHITDIYVFISG